MPHTEDILDELTTPPNCPDSSNDYFHFLEHTLCNIHTRRSTSFDCQNRLGERMDRLKPTPNMALRCWCPSPARGCQIHQTQMARTHQPHQTQMAREMAPQWLWRRTTHTGGMFEKHKTPLNGPCPHGTFGDYFCATFQHMLCNLHDHHSKYSHHLNNLGEPVEPRAPPAPWLCCMKASILAWKLFLQHDRICCRRNFLSQNQVGARKQGSSYLHR